MSTGLKVSGELTCNEDIVSANISLHSLSIQGPVTYNKDDLNYRDEQLYDTDFTRISR